MNSDFIEVLFQLLILVAQLSAVFVVAALVSDRIIDPIVHRWRK